MDFVDDRGKSQSEPPPQERLEWLRKQEISRTALSRYLEDLGIETPGAQNQIYQHTARTLDESEFEKLQEQFRYAGRVSCNYFVVVGISSNLDLVKDNARSHFPISEEVEGEKREPYLVKVDEIDDRLYLVFGHNISNKTHDPETGAPVRRLIPDECIVVVYPNSDLVEIRTSDTPMAKKICNGLARSLGIRLDDDVVYKPPFGSDFQQAFNAYVEKYINLKVRVREEAGGNVGTITFSSRTDANNEYLDVREDPRVEEELETNKGEISQGYVELHEGFSFRVNRPQSKIFIRKYEREDRINAVTTLINDVLRQSGGYSQTKLSGLGNVPD